MRKIISIALICLLTVTSLTVGAMALEPQAVYVTYEEFGAVGDGETCDFDAIIAAHAYANTNDLPVRACDDAIYYIGESGRTAIIQTNTYWGDAQFIIDNATLTVYGQHRYDVFRVESRLEVVELTGVETLVRGQESIDITLPQSALVLAEDTTTRRFIRRGTNADQGSPQLDIFVVDQNGNVDPETPILWDFDNITSLRALPIDEETLTITGGHFTTVENEVFWNAYVNRGLRIMRSNVVMDDVHHELTNESTDRNSPNSGFLLINNAADITVRNSSFAGRKTAIHGSYDIQFTNAVNILFYNIRQNNCIHDRSRWGIMGANRSKNVVFDNVELSRFDFHRALHNGTLRNSIIGHSGVLLIGSGTFLLENTEVHAHNLIGLRSDFGSSWEGDIIIRNSVFRPLNDNVVLISVTNDGWHDFGMPTFMPRNICIDGLMIYDGNRRFFRFSFTPPFYNFGPSIFSANHPYGNDALFVTLFWDALTNQWFRRPPHPIAPTERVTLRNVETESGRCLRVSKNIFRFSACPIFGNIRVTRR